MTTSIAKFVNPRCQVQAAVRRVLVVPLAWLLCAQMAFAQTGTAPKAPIQAPLPSLSLSALQDQPVAGQGRGQLVFYRPAQQASAHPLRLYIADAYHATLFAGTYTELCVSPGLTAVRLKAIHPAATGFQSIDTELVSGQSRYFRVESLVEQGVRWQEVTPDTARQEAGSAMPTGFQSRVRRSEACRTPSESAVAPTAAVGTKAASK